MAVSCQTVVGLIERYAPKHLALDWDNVGLQIGHPAQQVNRLFLSLDLNEEILAEALAFEADMLIVHHTPFFKPLQNLRTDLPAGRIIAGMLKKDIVLYTAHTNLDAAWGGVSDILAEKLDIVDVKTLSTSWQQKLYKLVVFVPSEYTQNVQEAVSRAGAGWIGNYSDCSFRTEGTGTFRPLADAKPFIGSKGVLEQVAETRLETIVQEEKLDRVIKAMLKAHPYEEVAYDVYPLLNAGETTGLGRVGRLSQPLTLEKFLTLVSERLGCGNLRYCGDLQKPLQKVALCGGSGAGFIKQAVYAGADVFLTADVKYHEAQEALASNLALIDAGHYATEQPVIRALADFLRGELAEKSVAVGESKISTDPFSFFQG